MIPITTSNSSSVKARGRMIDMIHYSITASSGFNVWLIQTEIDGHVSPLDARHES